MGSPSINEYSIPPQFNLTEKTQKYFRKGTPEQNAADAAQAQQEVNDLWKQLHSNGSGQVVIKEYGSLVDSAMKARWLEGALKANGEDFSEARTQEILNPSNPNSRTQNIITISLKSMKPSSPQ